MKLIVRIHKAEIDFLAARRKGTYRTPTNGILE